MTDRKPSPDYVTRAEVEAMISEALAAERRRQEAAKPLGVRTSPTFKKK